MTSYFSTTIGQREQFDRELAKAGLTQEDVIRILANPSLAVEMVSAIALPHSNPTIPWTPVSEYVDRIMARSRLRDWGFTKTDANRLTHEMHDHDGPLTPTGVSIWLGKGLEYNWVEMLRWLRDEVHNLGLGLQSSFGPADLNFRRGSHKSATYRIADVVGFDLVKFWRPRDGLVVCDNLHLRREWPGLAVVALLALNPQVAAMMDGVTIPHMLAAGLTVDSDRIPVFSCLDGRINVSDQPSDGLWKNVSMVDYSVGR